MHSNNDSNQDSEKPHQNEIHRVLLAAKAQSNNHCNQVKQQSNLKNPNQRSSHLYWERVTGEGQDEVGDEKAEAGVGVDKEEGDRADQRDRGGDGGGEE